MRNTLDAIYASSKDAADYARSYSNYVCHLLEKLDYASVARVIEVFSNVRDRGNRIYFLGNGGSAATASHFANDLVLGVRFPDKPFKAISLVDNQALVTALANDQGYGDIFAQQLEIHLESGDVVVAVSASGDSPNLIKAIEFSNSRNNETVAFVGFGGGRLKEIAKHNIHVETPHGDYGPCEDLHLILDHLMSTFLSRRVREESKTRPGRSEDSHTSQAVNL